MILTVTPNPALDKTAVVPGFGLGSIYRTADPQWLAGGKGFNVARALRVLGGEPLIVAPLAGHIGTMVRDLAAAEGLKVDCAWFEGETRTCQSIVDPSTGAVTELYEVGPVLPAGTWEQVVALVEQHLPRAQAVTVSGGFARGTPADGLRRIVEGARDARVPVLLDTYGGQLLRALDAEPDVLKCNGSEAGDILGGRIGSVAEAVEAARELQMRGAREVVITLGAKGAAGVDAAGKPFAWRAPRVDSVSAVGSGDVFLAALALERTGGRTLREAARAAVAAGAANTLRTGAGIFERAQAEALRAEVRPLRLASRVAVG